MNLQVSETFNKTSKVFYDDRYTQIVSMGGSRSSKSYSILQLLMLELMRKNNIKITVWRNVKLTCRSTVMEDFQNIIMFDERIYGEFKENKQLGTFVYKPTGSKIVFEGADSIGKVLGGAQHISFFNEVTEFSKEVYLQITQRTSGKVICDYNPSKDFWLEKYRFDENTVFIHSTFKDNAFCSKHIIDRLLSYEPWVPDSYKIIGTDLFYEGELISDSNQPPPNEKNILKDTADEYHWRVYGLGFGSEKPNRIYKKWIKISEEDFENLEYVSYYGLDFGTANPTACVEVKYDGNNGFYICPRLYKPLTDMEASLSSTIHEKIPRINKYKDLIVADSAKEAYITILRNAGYMIKGAIKGSGSLGAGITLIQNYTIYYVSTEEIETEYANYSWAVDRYDKSTDDPIKLDDHYLDAIRYIITYLTEYLHIKT